jgi:hypothetical protein
MGLFTVKSLLNYSQNIREAPLDSGKNTAIPDEHERVFISLSSADYQRHKCGLTS